MDDLKDVRHCVDVHENRDGAEKSDEAESHPTHRDLLPPSTPLILDTYSTVSYTEAITIITLQRLGSTFHHG